MKYVYGKKIKTLRDRLTTGLAALALLANTAGMSLPFLLTQRAAAASSTVHTTDLSGWDLSETRSAGHNQLVTSGLRVWTDNNTSQAKAAGYYDAADFELDNAGDFSIAWTGTSPAPGGQLVVDLDNDGSPDGILVVEAVYGGIGGQLWLPSIWGATINASMLPHEVGGGGYPNQGLLTSWNAAFPDAKVVGIGYSLGSGILGDGVISSIIAGDVEYTFGLPPYVPTTPPTKPVVDGDVIFDSIPSVLPSNSTSVGYQATQTRELGDKITFDGTSRDLKHAAVTLSSWACETGGGTSCVTTPGATFNHPITLNLYNVAGDGSVGTLIDSVTQTFAIPYRPSADPTCPGGTAWRDTNGSCFNGMNHVIVFDASGITVPDSIIYSVAYNTQTYGSPAVGVAGPYNSLNVSLIPSTPAVGADQNAGEVFWNSTYGGRTLGLNTYSGYAAHGNPAVMFTAQAPNTAPTVTFADPTPAENTYVRGTITPHVLATDDYGMGSYFIRLWKDAFESGSANLVVNNCWSAPGAFLLGTNQDVTCSTIDTTTLSDGKYVLSAQFQDGHIVWGQNLRTFNIDNTPPKFTIKPESVGNAAIHTFSNVSFKLEDPGNGQIDYVTINGVKKELTNNKWSDVNGVKPGTFGAVEGENTLVIFDAAGNSTTYVFYLDTTAPEAPTNLHRVLADSTVVPCGAYIRPQVVTPTWTASISPDVAYYEYSSANPDGTPGLNKKNIGKVTSYNTNGWMPTEGVGTYFVRAVDKIGLTSAWAECSITYDATRPTVELLSPENGAVNPTEYRVKGVDNNALQTVTAHLYDETNTTLLKNCSATVTPAGADEYTLTCPVAGLAPGTYTIRYNARDLAGNLSFTKTSQFVIAAPVAPSVLGLVYNEQPDGTELNSGDTTYLKDFTFTLTGSPTTVRYQLKYWNDIVGSPFKEASPWAPGNDSWDGHMTTLGTYTDLFTQGYGTHYFSFSACDADNNCSDFSEPFVVTYAEDGGNTAGCSTDEICCDAVNAADAEGCDDGNDDEDEESEGETGGVVNGAFTDTPSNGLGGQVLGATDGLTNTGTQNSGLFVLLAMGLVGIAFVTMRRKQEN